MTTVPEKLQEDYVEPIPMHCNPVKFMYTKWLLPSWDGAHVVRSVIFFADTVMNEAHVAAKEIVRSHMEEWV